MAVLYCSTVALVFFVVVFMSRRKPKTREEYTEQLLNILFISLGDFLVALGWVSYFENTGQLYRWHMPFMLFMLGMCSHFVTSFIRKWNKSVQSGQTEDGDMK